MAKLTPDQVDDLIEQWADEGYAGQMSLPDFLGWTQPQYARYVENGEIPDEEKPESD